MPRRRSAVESTAREIGCLIEGAFLLALLAWAVLGGVTDSRATNDVIAITAIGTTAAILVPVTVFAAVDNRRRRRREAAERDQRAVQEAAAHEQQLADRRSAVATAGGVHFEYVSRTYPGSAAHVTIGTDPGATCSIRYVLPSGQESRASGLTTKTASSDGQIRWAWSISSRAGIGEGRVEVDREGKVFAAPLRVMENSAYRRRRPYHR